MLVPAAFVFFAASVFGAQPLQPGPSTAPAVEISPDESVGADTGAASAGAAPRVHESVWSRLDKPDVHEVKAWVFFQDKGVIAGAGARAALDAVEQQYDARALNRRRLRRTRPGLVDAADLPVAPTYVAAVAATGARIRRTSRWVNAASVTATREQIEQIAQLAFVTRIQLVRQSRRAPVSIDPAPQPAPRGVPVFYGEAEAQLLQINLPALHTAGFTGAGVVVGILDTGFERSHNAFNEPGHVLNVVAEYDFVSDDNDTSFNPADAPGQHNHGTLILGVLGAYKPGELVGGAYDASFILCKTEDVSQEVQAEEDDYVAGLEFIEMNGGDMATASLGYIDWYTQADLDGLTAVTTIAVNIATANGLYCLNAAGNAGHDADPGTSSLIAPADALQVLTCGAADDTGAIAGFSSDGPSFDGRVKPEILARGINTRTVSPSDPAVYVGANGTSLSTPVAAAAVACLIQAHPMWTVDQMRTYLMLTADDYVANGTFDPLYVRGYGVINAFEAAAEDCNDNGIADPTDLLGGAPDCNGNGIIDACDIATGHSTDCNNNGMPDSCEGGADSDGDGIMDACDNCPAVSNAAQQDTDSDGMGDPCDNDDDNDGAQDGADIAPLDPGLCGDADADGCDDCTVGVDGFGPLPDGDPANDGPDGDADGLCDSGDNCPGAANPLQEDANNNGIGDPCEPPAAASAPHDRSKNRYISFAPNSGAHSVAYRVTRMAPLVEVGWVGTPFVSGLALLEDAPTFRVWSEPVIHVGDCGIVPDAFYQVHTIPLGSLPVPSNFLTVATTAQPVPRFWGDTVGLFSEGSWTEPNGVVNANDFVAALQTFQVLPSAPHVSVVDVQAASAMDPCLNRVVNIADVFLIIKAFQGDPYPFTTDPAMCPPCP